MLAPFLRVCSPASSSGGRHRAQVLLGDGFIAFVFTTPGAFLLWLGLLSPGNIRGGEKERWEAVATTKERFEAAATTRKERFEAEALEENWRGLWNWTEHI